MNETLKQLEELKKAIEAAREEIYLHNERVLRNIEKQVDHIRFQIEDDIADMMNALQDQQFTHGEQTPESMNQHQEDIERGKVA